MGLICIRPATEQDVKSISLLESSCFRFPRTEIQIRNAIHSASVITLIAELNNCFAAYVSLDIILDEAYISYIACCGELRRKGLAYALLQHLDCIAVKDGLSFISLEVREGNFSAVALYQKGGYRIVGLRKNYYEDPKENAIIMTKFFREA